MNGAAKSATDLSHIKEVMELNDGRALPALESGQVLVKVAVCTINDEDVYHMTDDYVNSKRVPMPRTVGFEGAGVVVASAVPWYAPHAPGVGRRVAFYADGGGAMTEYVVVDDPTSLIAIPDGTSYETAASAVTNPFTVLIMADRVKRLGHDVVINTVPAGALGRLFTKYCTDSLGITVIGTVRRDELKEAVLGDGAKYVLNMKDADFEDQLSQIVKETGCRFAYDGLGADMPRKLLKAMPPGSTVSVYSHIASEEITINAIDWFGKTLETFNANAATKELWTWQLLRVVSQMQKWMAQSEMGTTIRKSYPYDQFPEALVDSATGVKSNGKVQVIVSPELLQ